MRVISFAVGPVAMAVVVAVAIGEASAASKGVKRVGVQGGFSGVAGSEGSFAGYGGAVTGAWAVSDAWSLAANVTATSNRVTARGGRSLVVSEAFGALYALDVLQIVPYFGFMAAAYEMGGGGLDQTQVKFGAQLVLGLDYILSRDVTVGLEIRAHALPDDFLRKPDNPTPFYGTTFLKVEYAWGWF